MRAIGIAVTASAMAAASGATACSLNNWNAYIPDGTLLSKAISDAATIDLIRVSYGQPYCTTTEDQYYNGPVGPPTAGGCAEGSPRPYTARVLKRFKGHSPRTYSMTWQGDWEGSWVRGYNPLSKYVGFSDSRELPTRIQKVVGDEYDASVTTPLDFVFWDAPHVGFTTDMSSSCGGVPTALVGKTYLAFRRSNGSFISLQPADTTGGALAERLRELAKQPDIQLAPSLSVIDYFRSQRHASLVEVMECKGGKYFADEIGRLKLLRGRTDMLTKRNSAQAIPSAGSDEYRFNELSDFFTSIGQPCPPTGSIYLMIGRDKNLEWGTPPLFVPVNAEGLVQKADIPTKIKLSGPDSFTLEEAFEWFADGIHADKPAELVFEKSKSLPATEPKGIWHRIVDFFRNLFG